ncbi:sensor histidine kinase [Bdellovibrio svalbardensis]|uniref:histidine kinase n=1 Tax=Bdellovibrio svalbardensis TaxID=2972972 RepID=A0ABT6DDZ8_9BACT|nr:ATP-binding protein [Bdellovibrio svalbardensis]MDG0815048.1 ATP-binding protein [Bdellovibrio svalbardensis]
MRQRLGLAKNNPEIRKIFDEQSFEICARVDRSFAFLMGFQWLAAILVAWLVSPNTWLSGVDRVQESLVLAFVFGGMFSLPAIFASYLVPGEKATRYIVAIGQMLFSILFIHLTGGRIETHFHVFVSLAFVAFYKDVGVLWAAGAIILADHMIRGAIMPLSVYGDMNSTYWRWIEHGLWIAFENIVLWLGILKVREELWDMARSKYELIQAKDEAQRASVLKSSFISNMSHEIRTPLNSIIGFADVLNDSELNQEHKEYASTIHRCSESLLVLINDILDISKIENGLLEIDRHRFNVHKLHDDVQKMFLVRCREKGLHLEVKLDESIPKIAIGDSHRIRQVLVNLIGNAVKFTDRGGVFVQVEKDQDLEHTYKWKVQDTGVGIAPESQHQLFRAFVQGNASVSRNYGGSGLGLLISKNLIELMGGRISFDSQPGEGSTFSFTLKLE